MTTRRAFRQGEIERLVRERKPDAVLLRNWSAIDRAERDAGRAAGRPRIKLTTRTDLLEAARSERQ
jgi:ferredoxin--NADP+ reductase